MTAGVSFPECPVSLADRRVFTADGVVFTVADIARRARSGSREVHFAAAATTPSEAEEAFRRARGLLRADQLEAWLSLWEIAPEDFLRWCDDAASGTATATAWCALLCSGTFDAITAELLTAAAAACELGEPPAVAHDFDPTGWVENLVAERTSDEVLAGVLAAHRLDWTRLATTCVMAPRRGAAEELRHQVLNDGTDLRTAAARAGWPAHGTDDVLATFSPAGVRAAVAGARSGEVVGPVAAGDAWAVLVVEARTEPDLADPSARTRAQAVVRNDVIARAVARYVVA